MGSDLIEKFELKCSPAGSNNQKTLKLVVKYTLILSNARLAVVWL